jgi:hypothetical protein
MGSTVNLASERATRPLASAASYHAALRSLAMRCVEAAAAKLLVAGDYDAAVERVIEILEGKP